MSLVMEAPSQKSEAGPARNASHSDAGGSQRSAGKKFTATEREFDLAQRNFDFLMPYRKALLTTPEVAKTIGREQDFVRALIQDGRLEAHADSALGERQSSRVTRRSVLVYFARTAQYDPAQFIDAFADLLKALTPDQLTKLIILATRERAGR